MKYNICSCVFLRYSFLSLLLFSQFGVADTTSKATLASSEPTVVLENPVNHVTPQVEPSKKVDRKSYAGKFSEVLVGLAFVVALILVLSWLMKRVGYNTVSNNSQLMKVKSCLPLSTKEKLMLVEVDGDQILIGVAPGFVGHIKTLDSPIDFSAKEAPLNFSETLKNILVVNKGNTDDKKTVSDAPVDQSSNNIHA